MPGTPGSLRMSGGRGGRHREDPAVDPVVAVVLTGALPDHHEGSVGTSGDLGLVWSLTTYWLSRTFGPKGAPSG